MREWQSQTQVRSLPDKTLLVDIAALLPLLYLADCRNARAALGRHSFFHHRAILP